MIIYLLKSILCLLALLLIHRLLLQREVLHRFNRFYLMAAVLGSFLIPLYTIEVEVEMAAPPVLEAAPTTESPSLEYGTFSAVEEIQPAELTGNEAAVEPSVSDSPIRWKQLAWFAYGIVSFVLLIRFLRNLRAILGKIRNNPHVSYRNETLVLHPEKQSPFSFLRYIFVSRRNFEQEGISDAVFVHEQCHVRERHSWDILLIEALLVPFWFHPGLYLARHAIRLNHEFIADQAALGTTSIQDYQQQLLHILLATPTPSMVSSLNFSLTKKRMQMMNKKPNSPLKWLKLLALVPVIGALVYFFGEKVEVQPEEAMVAETSIPVIETPVQELEIDIRLLTDMEVKVDGKVIYVEQLNELIQEIKQENALVRLSVNPRLEMGAAADIQEILVENELRKVVLDEWPKYVESPDMEEERKAFYQNAYILVEDKNMEYSHKSYLQLTENERRGLFGPMTPPAKKSPHPMIFEEWGNKEKYALWLDEIVIPNEELDNIRPTDIVMFWTSRVTENARSARFPQPFQVHLYSEEYYEKELGPNSDRLKPLSNQDTITITQRRVTWGKNIQKYPDPNTAYLQKNARYEKLRTSGTIYIHKSAEEKTLLDRLYQELENEYSQSSGKRKKSLKQPIAPDSDTPRNGDPAQSRDEKIAISKLVNNRDNEMVYRLVQDGGFQSNALKEYLTRYGQFQTKAYENHGFSQKSDREIEVLRRDFDQMQRSYELLTIEERKTVQRVSFPYAKIEKDGKTIYKKFADLTEQERREMSC